MNKHILLTITFIIYTSLCQAFDFGTNKWTDFEGTLSKTKIQLSIYRFADGQIKGNYCYKKHESKIQLVGQIIGEQIELTEFLNGKPNGYFKGKIFTDNLDRFEGIWMDSSKTTSFEFKLTLQSISGSNYEHRYSIFFGTDNDVENFMKHVKTSLLTNDKEWIAIHISYPINTKLANKKAITIKNKEQLIENFDQIFYPAFKEEIKSFCSCNMFNNYQGIMLGNGQIWMNNTPNSTDKKFDYYITSINN
jgi:hypothetical protein